MVARGDSGKLTKIAKWVEEGKLISIIDKTYELKDYQHGFDRTREPGKRGRIIMKIADH